MHPSALYFGKVFFDKYIKNINKKIDVVEIGSQDVNGSLKDFFVCQENINYTGLDFATGKNVDIVIDDPYLLPLNNESVDVIISSSCFEHSEFFWLSFCEMLRVLKVGGLVYINVPSNGYIHRYPVDCWRFYPDSGMALVNWGNRCGYEVKLLESFISSQHSDAPEDRWNDFVAVFSKGENSTVYNERICTDADVYLNHIYIDNKLQKNSEFLPEDFKIQDNLKAYIIEAQENINALVASYQSELDCRGIEVERLKAQLNNKEKELSERGDLIEQLKSTVISMNDELYLRALEIERLKAE
ncbi:methyltransferase domain-containing protein [Aeromonas veronii]|uniref:methyltransferase domain-containing protein n=1 Tax=Aeromonas veronii TaxID=654 RepID=UPI003BA23169